MCLPSSLLMLPGVFLIQMASLIPLTFQSLKVRVKEHREEAEKISGGMRFTRGNRKLSEKERWSSAITDHIVHKNHVMNWDSAKLRQRESDWKVRGIKEAIWIRKAPGNINRDEGRRTLPPLYDDLLVPQPRD